MPQAKTPKPVSLAVPWAMPDPVIPLHSCQPAPDLQAHKISVAVMFLTCQIADAASCLRKITNRINLWMAQPRVQAFIKKNGAKKQTLQLSTYLVESNMLLQHIIKSLDPN